ncbi:MFS transporter [Jatrophihabitans telluris]|uniref:MFS transporter n=1 Tax=Jatrophihabitans telluris TaxID=2038343 RepID=A0ABY4R0J2_9ACTN|nr:MFS transporter [Jatrophihabitans telluris]UQX88987.1 MFS transporter [Jatrophihabitans telluris]
MAVSRTRRPTLTVSRNAKVGVPTSLALLVAGTFFMENFDGTVLATAAPRIARSFGVQSAQIGVAITAYLLAVAVLIPLSGWATDRVGARRTYVSAIVVFSVASALCAASVSLTELVVMRIAQGVGGAMMVPVGRLVVLRAIDKREMIRTIAYLTWPALVAPIVAPAVGGLLSTYASWRWIFLINLPLGLLASALALRLIKPAPPTPRPRLDARGFIGSAVSLCAVVYLVTLLGAAHPQWFPIVGLACGAFVVGRATVAHLRSTPDPLLALSMLHTRTFRTAHAGGSVFRAVVNGVPFLLALLFQDQFGWSAAKAGGVVLVMFVGNLAIKPLTTPLLYRLGFRVVLVFTTLAAGTCVAMCAALRATTPLAVTIVVVLLVGVFRSIGFTAYNSIAFADVDYGAMTHANTLAATIQQFAQGLGVALAVLALRSGQALFDGSVPYRFAFLVLAILVTLPLVEAVRLSPFAGDGLRSRQ